MKAANRYGPRIGILRYYGLLIWLLSMFFFIPVFSRADESEVDPTCAKYKLEDCSKWYWNDQLKPTILRSKNSDNLIILAYGAVASLGAFQYDGRIYRSNVENEDRIMNRKTASNLSALGAGHIGVGLVVTQLFLDNPNGLKHARALILTSTSHVLLALLAQRERPNGKEDFLPFNSSFPSGHASSAFATATSLAYAYGYKAGVPAYAFATAVSLARLSENKHWLSDITAGAAIGVFWARASHMDGDSETVMLYPLLFRDGGGIGLHAEF